MQIFDTLIYHPLYNTLIFFYNVIPGHDFGIAIILITLLLKSVLIPLSKKQIESQKKMQELQPQMKEIQKKYKNDKEKQTKALMEFYNENKTSTYPKIVFASRLLHQILKYKFLHRFASVV